MRYADAPDWLNNEGELVLNLSGGGYEWDLIDVWRRKSDGRVFMYADGGCSCNYPYDWPDEPSWERLTPLTDVKPFLAAIDGTHFLNLKADQIIQHAATVSKAIGRAS